MQGIHPEGPGILMCLLFISFFFAMVQPGNLNTQPTICHFIFLYLYRISPILPKKHFSKTSTTYLPSTSLTHFTQQPKALIAIWCHITGRSRVDDDQSHLTHIDLHALSDGQSNPYRCNDILLFEKESIGKQETWGKQQKNDN